MNDDTLADLKQFIAATMSQGLMEVREDIVGIKSDIGVIKSDIKRIDRKIDDLSDSVAEAINSSK